MLRAAKIVRMETKLSQLQAAYSAGNIRQAVAIAARFPRLGEIRNQVLDAQLAFTNPAFCRGIKKDPERLIEAGRAAIEAAYITRQHSRTAPQAAPAV